MVSATPIRDKVHPAEEDVSKADAESKTYVDETKGQRVHICEIDCRNYVPVSDICSMERVTDALHPLRPVSSGHREKFESEICYIGFETIYGVLTLTLRGDIATIQDAFVVH